MDDAMFQFYEKVCIIFKQVLISFRIYSKGENNYHQKGEILPVFKNGKVPNLNRIIMYLVHYEHQ